MPIIARQHRPDAPFPKDADFTPTCAWPDDCTVQWGGRGVVLSKKGSYGTAFFEAFPKGPGFFRGEGPTLAEAEVNCFEKWSRFSICDHRWARGFQVTSRSEKLKHGAPRPKLRGKTHYTNGGAICRRCGAFASMFQPILRLGAWRDPISASDLVDAAEGGLCPSPHPSLQTPDMVRYIRRRELHLRLAGVQLPPTPLAPRDYSPFEDNSDDPYIAACRKAVVDWYLTRGTSSPETSESTIGDFFAGMDRTMLDHLVTEELARRAPLPEDDRGPETMGPEETT